MISTGPGCGHSSEAPGAASYCLCVYWILEHSRKFLDKEEEWIGVARAVAVGYSES